MSIYCSKRSKKTKPRDCLENFRSTRLMQDKNDFRSQSGLSLVSSSASILINLGRVINIFKSL